MRNLARIPNQENWKLNSAKNNPRKWYHIGLPRLKRSFNGLRFLSDSQIIPLQIPIGSLVLNKEEWSCRRKISNKQSNKALHHFSTSTEQLER